MDMRRTGFVALLLAVLAAQVWVTLRAQVVLAVEAAVVLLALAGWGLMAYARGRRRAQTAADRGRAGVRGTAAPQGTPVAMPLLPSVTYGTGSEPVATVVDDRDADGDPRTRPLTGV
ncbi:hypothetical protein EBM89_01025 [Cellulomonas triticagri]|uniref:Uncharacterized protein n=2 Tax=Cellulomonas triticagri TaxID=2483352 RepID=A0A3M2JRC6_9CELL|nr:hypothetical protein EBM89_01025 [Cellulomonas triticagri]